MLRLHSHTPLLAALFLCAVASSAQEDPPLPAAPTSGGYTPPALSLESLAASDKTISDATLAYSQTNDSAAFRRVIQSAATAGDVRAQLFLAQQYIPEQCALDPRRDVPNCGSNTRHLPKVIFATNPLDLPASYDDACHWLERASEQGSGEASEILAQLITRMLSNGHSTAYTAADSTRLHALARMQGFDIEPISVSCYQLTPGDAPLTFTGNQPHVLTAGSAPLQPFNDGEIDILQAAGAHGTLRFEGQTGGDESALLNRAAGPPVHIRIILDHNPEHEIHLPIPEHNDVIYLQHEDRFLAFPRDTPTLPQFLSVMPQRAHENQVSIYIQQVSGAYSSISCARFDQAAATK